MYTHATRDILYVVRVIKNYSFSFFVVRLKLYSRQLALSSRSPSLLKTYFIYIHIYICACNKLSKLMIRKTDFKATRRIRLLFFSRQRFAPRAPNISPPSGPRYTRILPTSSATPTPLDSDRLSSLASTRP